MLPETDDDLLVLRPLGGTDDEIAGIFAGRSKPVEPATFALPDPTDLGDYRSGRLLRDAAAARLPLERRPVPLASAGIAVEPRPYQFVPLLMALKLDPVRLLIADDVGIGKTDRGRPDRPRAARPGRRRSASPCSARRTWPSSGSGAARQVPPRRRAGPRRHRGPASSAAWRRRVALRPLPASSSSRPTSSSPTAAATTSSAPAPSSSSSTRPTPAPPPARAAAAATSATSWSRAWPPTRAATWSSSPPRRTPATRRRFRNLLGLLDPASPTCPTTSDGERNGATRRARPALRPAPPRRHPALPRRRHAVPRAGWSPRRPTRSRPSTATLFDDVLAYAREQVRDGAGGAHRQRVRWWSALALLRALASSPAAAAATLRTRAANAEADDASRRPTSSAAQPCSTSATTRALEGIDVAPGADTDDDDEPTSSQPTGAACCDLARDADALARRRTTASSPARHELVKELLERRLQPDRLLPLHRHRRLRRRAASRTRSAQEAVEVVSVTGELPPPSASERVARARPTTDRRHVLVATDCLSEGVNLQEHFDAVVHYDLAWNPTRHEQREGRVDRFGQPEDTVRAVTFYGSDNRIDGIVLDVLIRKHRRSATTSGVSVPVPGDTEEVVEALFEGLLLREESGSDRRRSPASTSSSPRRRKSSTASWESVGDREKRSRTMFAQESVKTEDVARELHAVRAAIGSGEEVERFAKAAFKAHGAVVSENGNVKIDLSEVPRAVKEAIGANGTDRITAQFELPVKDGEVYLSRTHPIIEGLASHVMDTALDPLGEGEARRCGVTSTSSIERRTTLLLVRYRYHIITRYPGGRASPPGRGLPARRLLRSAADPRWLGPEDAEALLLAEPEGNVPPDRAEYFLRQVIAQGDALKGAARRRRPRAGGGAPRGPPARAAGLQADRRALQGGAEPAARRAWHLRLPPRSGTRRPG